MSYAVKLKSVVNELSKGLLEREEVIKLVLLAFFSGKSIFLYGPPGTAKSMIARRSALAFGENNNFFTYLMNRFSTPEEVFGPIDIKALKENKLKRATKGYLPQAHFAFLDEIWKSSPAILNTLLTIVNERIYQDGGENISVPLCGLICASNEFPEANQGLEALYDRMLIRYPVLPLKEVENFKSLLSGENVEFSRLKESFDLDELKDIYLQSQKVVFSDEAMSLICELKAKIELYNQSLENSQELIYVSDRRYKQMADLLKVSAFLNDRREILAIDLALLKHCLWSSEKDKPVLDTILKEIFKKDVDNKELKQLQNYIANLESDITEACFTKAGKAKKIDEGTKNDFIAKLRNAQEHLQEIKQDQQEEYEEEKIKNQNLFLDEDSYKIFLSSYEENFENIAQENLKIEQLLYDIEHLEQKNTSKNNTSKKSNKSYLYTPTTKEQLVGLVRHSNVDLRDIDISNITDMSGLFVGSERTDFSGLAEWDVSHVRDMSNMFASCENFDEDISGWDVSNVTNMSGMFTGATSFNQPLNDWDVSNVTDMTLMFAGVNNLEKLGEELSKTSIYFGSHFLTLEDYTGATSFNQPLNDWDVSNVTNMSLMFTGARSFNQPLVSWDVSKVEDMSKMFVDSPQKPRPAWYKG